MINAPFLSTAAIAAPSIRSADRIQRRLDDVQVELASGKKSDLERQLGLSVGLSAALRQEKSHLTAIVDANTTVSARLQASQSALATIADAGKSLVSTLLLSASDQVDPGVVVETARSALSAVTSAFNTTLDGTHLFAGVNTDVVPLADYFLEPVSSSRSSVATAFTRVFGVTQSDPTIASIEEGAIQAFLRDDLGQLFDGSEWNASWSQASDQAVTSRISPNRIVPTSVTVNDKSIRDLLRGITMVADLGIEHMNSETRRSVVTTASTLLSSALAGVDGLHSQLGLAAASTTDASDTMIASISLADRMLSDREAIDPAAVAAEIGTLTRDLEAAYAMISRLSKLSLLNSL